MGNPAALLSLETAALERGPGAYVVTVTPRGTPHVVQAQVRVLSGGLLAQVGGRTAANTQEHPQVSVLYPSRHPGDYSLIVDGVATVESEGADFLLRLTPNQAVLHRSGPAPDPGTSSCGSDCIRLPLPGE